MQAEAGDAVQQASQALNKLKLLAPRLIFQDLFAALAWSSVAAGAAAAAVAAAEDSHMLITGVRQVEQLLQSALAQPCLSRSQLHKLCQVCGAVLCCAVLCCAVLCCAVLRWLKARCSSSCV